MVYADLIRAVSLYHADSSVLDTDLIRFINIYSLVCIKIISSIWIPIDTYNDLCMIRLSGQNLIPAAKSQSFFFMPVSHLCCLRIVVMHLTECNIVNLKNSSAYLFQ